MGDQTIQRRLAVIIAGKQSDLGWRFVPLNVPDYDILTTKFADLPLWQGNAASRAIQTGVFTHGKEARHVQIPL